MKNVVFVCTENSNRSQLAEALAKLYASNELNAFSAGSKASGKVNPKAITAMRELGYDMSEHRSIAVDDLPVLEWDFIITMGCGDACPHLPAKERVDWQLPDPKAFDQNYYNTVRDYIKIKVLELTGRLDELS